MDLNVFFTPLLAISQRAASLVMKEAIVSEKTSVSKYMVIYVIT